jgi:hypothetical protein
MKLLLPVSLFACAALAVARPALGIDQQTSAFLPAAGQTVHYRFTDTVTTAKKSKNVSGQLGRLEALEGPRWEPALRQQRRS